MLLKELFEDISRRGFLKGAAGAAALSSIPKRAQAKGKWELLLDKSKSDTSINKFYVDENSIEPVVQVSERPYIFSCWTKQILEGGELERNGQPPKIEILIFNKVNLKDKTIVKLYPAESNNVDTEKYAAPKRIIPDSADDVLLDYLHKKAAAFGAMYDLAIKLKK